MKKLLKRYVLTFYLSSRLLATTFTTVIILTAIMEVLTLLEQTSSILERQLGLKGVVHFMMLKLPLLFNSVLPLSILIGFLIALTQLTINNEITILRSIGLSTWGLIKKLIPVTLLLSFLCFIMSDQITPKTELDLATWWNKTNPHPEKENNFYFYSNLDIINIDHIAYGGNKITGLTIIKRRDLSHIDSVLIADEVIHKNHQWIFSHAKFLQNKPNIPLKFHELTNEKERIWNINLTPHTLIRLSSKSMPQSIHNMVLELSYQQPFKMPTNYIKTTIWGRLCLPFTFIMMLIITVLVTYIPPRAGLRSWIPIYCLGYGLLFIIFQEVLHALGKAGTIPAPVASLSAFLVFMLATCTIILSVEEKQ